jgi:DNA-binding transcriptional LysR family regulator
VTRSIAALEDHLGAALITRTTRSSHLTEQGEMYLQSCQQILDDIDSAERNLRGESAVPRGTLKIATPVVFGRLHVLPIVTRLLAEHRGLTVQLNLSDRNIHLVEEGFDAAVRIGELADSGLVAARLGTVSRVLVASPAYLKQRGMPLAPAELSDHDIVAFEGLGISGEWRFEAHARPLRFEPRLLVNSVDAAIAAAEAGVGITRILSYQAKASVLAGRLIPMLQKFVPPELPVSVVYPSRRIASANVAVFVQAARDYFKANPLGAVKDWQPDR